ncbi:MAG: DNA alkylation repair protein [Bacilli bacterium]
MTLVETFYLYRNNDRAISMGAYMKNNFSFLGIESTKRRLIQKRYVQAISTEQSLHRAFVLELWKMPEREFQYAAIDYLIKNKHKLVKEDIHFVRRLIVQKPWWDSVDLISAHLVGHLVEMYPVLIEEVIIPWSTDENIWLRRASILFQLKYKENIQWDVLRKVIENNEQQREFFIKKAIGWMLREASKTNRSWVQSFIEKQSLSTLSVREASKYLA